MKFPHQYFIVVLFVLWYNIIVFQNIDLDDQVEWRDLGFHSKFLSSFTVLALLLFISNFMSMQMLILTLAYMYAKH